MATLRNREAADRGATNTPIGLTNARELSMPTATQTPTTPTRRTAIGFSVAAFAAGLTVPALASAAEPDAELIARVDQMHREWTVTENIAAIQAQLPEGITDQSKAAEERMSLALDDWNASTDAIFAMEPRTLAGLAAKARALQHYIRCMVFSEIYRTADEQLATAEYEIQFAWSLADDLMRVGAA
jgi:hypothetical protein